MKKFPIALAVLVLATSANASDELYTSDYAACMDASGGVTVEMMDCIATEIATQDAALNAAYKALGAQLEPARKAQLVTAQRAWIQYRDANCAFYADPDGGSLAGIEANSCVLRATAERTVELQELMREPEQ